MGGVARQSDAKHRDSRQAESGGHQSLAQAAFIDPACHQPIGQPAEQQRRDRLDEIDGGQQAGHVADREPARLDQEQRQPGEQEEERIGVGEMADAHRPHRFLARDAAQRNHLVRRAALAPVGARHQQPRHQPDKRRQPEDQEYRPPAKMDHDQPAGKNPQSGAEIKCGGDGAVGDAAVRAGNLGGDDLRCCGEGDPFADAERESEHDERGEPAHETGQCGRQRPQREAGGDEAVDAKAVGQPADDELGGGVDPGKGGNRDAEPGSGQRELGLEPRRGNRQRATIDVIEQHQQRERNGQRRSRSGCTSRARQGRHLLSPAPAVSPGLTLRGGG